MIADISRYSVLIGWFPPGNANMHTKDAYYVESFDGESNGFCVIIL